MNVVSSKHSMLGYTNQRIRLGAQSSVIWSWLTIAAIGLAIGAGKAGAQSDYRTHVTLSAGVAEYDLAGTGNAGVGALGVSFPVLSFLTVDPSLAFLRYGSQSDSRVSYLLPEVSARFQVPGRTVNPYLALGGGLATVIAGPGETDFTVHAAVGTYVWLGNQWAIRPEARVRAIDPFVGTTADVTLGFSRRL